MPKYIDADKLNGKLMDEYYGMISDESIKIYKIMQMLDNAPTADVEEVKHGRWRYKLLDNFKKVECTCTHCGWRGIDNYDSYVDISDFEYCPHCGAKMDGGESK